MPNLERIREHQANERTFLAWLRTSIALIGFGFAIARFGIFLRQINAALTQTETTVNPLFNSVNLGMILVFFGIMTIALAAWRYNQVFWQIERNDYQPQRLPVFLITLVVTILGFFCVPLLFWGNQVSQRPSSQPKQTQSRYLR
jgi:putative membrane protein